jgi:DNA topoisomerase-3
MPRVLNVAEKPSIAKSISGILSGGQQTVRQGGNKYCKLFDFAAQVPGFGHCQMVVTSVLGHILESDFRPPYSGWQSCDPVELFEAPIHKSVNKVGLALVKRCLESDIGGLARVLGAALSKAPYLNLSVSRRIRKDSRGRWSRRRAGQTF